jgi:hypothetical protein
MYFRVGNAPPHGGNRVGLILGAVQSRTAYFHVCYSVASLSFNRSAKCDCSQRC